MTPARNSMVWTILPLHIAEVGGVNRIKADSVSSTWCHRRYISINIIHPRPSAEALRSDQTSRAWRSSAAGMKTSSGWQPLSHHSAAAAVIETFRWKLLSNYSHLHTWRGGLAVDGTLLYLLNGGALFSIHHPPSPSSLRRKAPWLLFWTTTLLSRLRKELWLGDRGLVRRQPKCISPLFRLYCPICSYSQQRRSSRNGGAVG